MPIVAITAAGQEHSGTKEKHSGGTARQKRVKRTIVRQKIDVDTEKSFKM